LEGDDQRTKLVHFRKVLFARLYAMRGIIEALGKLERLSTRWANTMEDCWDCDVTSCGALRLLDAVRSIAEWRDETAALVSRLKGEQDELWIKKKLDKYEFKPVISWFLLGNPAVVCLDGHANGERSMCY
jgi:hypothetical protein